MSNMSSSKPLSEQKDEGKSVEQETSQHNQLETQRKPQQRDEQQAAKVVDELAKKNDERDDQSQVIDVNRLVREVQSALTTKQRMNALHKLQSTLQYLQQFSSAQHRNTRDDEFLKIDAAVRELVSKGTLQALTLQLKYVLTRYGSTVEDELSQILTAMQEYIEALASHVSKHPNDDNLLELQCQSLDNSFFLQLCNFLVVAPISNEDSNHPNAESVFRCLSTVLSILEGLSRTSTGTRLILACRKLFIRLLDAINGNSDNNCMPVHCLSDAMGILKNLSHRSEEQRRALLEYPGLLDAIVTATTRSTALTSSTSFTAHGERIMERIAATLCNFSVSADCRPVLVRKPTILTAMMDIAQSNISLNQSNIQNHCRSLRTLLLTFSSLATDNDSTLILTYHGDGCLPKLLRRLLRSSTDAVVRKRAARTLRQLINEATSPMLLVQDSGDTEQNDTAAELIQILSQTALTDESNEVRTEAAEAVARCAGLVYPTEPYNRQQQNQEQQTSTSSTMTELLLQSLLALRTNRVLSHDIWARAVRDQASHKSNRKPMLDCRSQRSNNDHHDSNEGEPAWFVEVMAHGALQPDVSESSQEDICRAFSYLAQEPENKERLLRVAPVLLRLLIACLGNSTTNRPTDQQQERPRPIQQGRTLRQEYSVDTLVQLAESSANRKLMVQHDSFLQSLVQFASATDDNRIKEQVKQVIVLLVNEI